MLYHKKYMDYGMWKSIKYYILIRGSFELENAHVFPSRLNYAINKLVLDILKKLATKYPELYPQKFMYYKTKNSVKYSFPALGLNWPLKCDSFPFETNWLH